MPDTAEQPPGPAISQPTLEELGEALEHHIMRGGAVRPGVAGEIARERGWAGRVMEVLGVLTESSERMAYLAGGRRPGEVMAWLPAWVDAPLSVEEIRLIVAAGGWDPEPFVPVVHSGLLERLLLRKDGSLRRVRGELAGAWLSDQFALADDEEVLREVEKLLEQQRREIS